MNKKELVKYLLDFNLNNIDSFERLLKDTLATNKKFNLTAIKDEEKFRELMILDSLYPLHLLDFNDKKVIDVGTGGGYPGLPLALASKGEFTLLDSTKKKIDHISEYVKENHINNVVGVCDRAEEFAKKNIEKYDIAIARAVSSLNILVEIILPLLKIGGFFIAMKGLKGKEEIEDAKRALKELGGEVVEIDKFELPERKEVRINILIKKIKPSPKKYPRVYKQIIDKPL